MTQNLEFPPSPPDYVYLILDTLRHLLSQSERGCTVCDELEVNSDLPHHRYLELVDLPRKRRLDGYYPRPPSEITLESPWFAAKHFDPTAIVQPEDDPRRLLLIQQLQMIAGEFLG